MTTGRPEDLGLLSLPYLVVLEHPGRDSITPDGLGLNPQRRSFNPIPGLEHHT